MKLPEHANPIDAERALAPYNFVELPERIAALDRDGLPDQDRYHADRLSGQIACTLIVESPLYIRAGLDPSNFDAGAQTAMVSDFFYHQSPEQPVIPGSALRGMLRSILEIASYSKIEMVTDKKYAFRAPNEAGSHGKTYRSAFLKHDGDRRYTPKVKGGFAHCIGSDWFIRPAEEHEGTTWARLRIDRSSVGQLRPWGKSRNAFELFVAVAPATYTPTREGFIQIKLARVAGYANEMRRGYHRAALVKGNWIGRKVYENVVFTPDEKKSMIRIPPVVVRQYLEQLTPDQVRLLGPSGVLTQNQPLFYLQGGEGELVEFIGHCPMFRILYPGSPRDFVPPRLRDEHDLDLAQAVFGFVRQNANTQPQSYAGRVQVTDAALEPGQADIWLDRHSSLTPKILSTPKPTSFQHYLVQPQSQSNAARTAKSKGRRLDFADYAADTPADSVIRGHKLYWHKGQVSASDIAEETASSPRDTQHTRINPVRAGVQFKFGINFSNLNLVELGALLWVLDIAADDKYRLKLGMGKPLGMGAVKILSQLQLIDRHKRYSTLLDEDSWFEGNVKAQDIAVQALQSFEYWVISRIQADVDKLSDLHRIQQLLTLLSWPGPNPDQTRYLEIERREPASRRGRTNEFRYRNVLPDPMLVVKKRGKRPTSQASPRAGADLPPGHFRGTVKRYDHQRGYGFIEPEGESRPLFVHRTALSGIEYLEAGQSVIFQIEQTPRGPVAVAVKKLDS